MGAPYVAPRNLLVDLLIVLFGVSSWVGVNGLWVELPILVKKLPESWKLASYIVITTQIANLGPVVFSAARKKWSQKVLEVPIIHASLAVVITSCILLSIFWESKTYIFNELHSTALLILTFFVSCVDCTSSLLYLPFIANFKEQYVISYMIGAGLSGPISGMLALSQGVGGYTECINKTVENITEYGNETTFVLEPYYPPPRFSVNIFFMALSLQMIISWIAFFLLNKLPQAQKERVCLMPISRPSIPALEENFQSSVEKDISSSIEKTTSSEQNLLGKPFLTRSQYATLLVIQGFVNMLHNGILLSIQTYSCLPYGSLPYHLVVTLSSFANPLCCFIAVFFPVTNVFKVICFTVFSAGWGSYILLLALSSPNPPLVGTVLGSFLVVFAWVTVAGTTAFIKACIASILRRDGGQVALFQCGVVTQVGSMSGAIISFCMIQYTTLFHSYSPCS